METKTIQLEIPEYLTIKQFQDLPDESEENSLKRYLKTISALTQIDEQELEYWSLDSIKKVAGLITNLGNHKNEFHSLLEWKGIMYGYSNIKQATLGEYIDLENLCKDVKTNLHKIAALIYRPIVAHKFNTFEFTFKQKIKIVTNTGVANVFDYYDVEKYNSKIRAERENDFLDFPAHIILGALNFFLVNGSQYLNSIAYSRQMMSEKMKKMLDSKVMASLLANTGVGGGLFTHSLRPIYSRLPETTQ